MQKITIRKATLKDYPVIQNMGMFYVYDASRDCGFPLPEDGLYRHKDYKNYFEEETREAYLVKVNNETAGFVLLNQHGTASEPHWNVGEYFILAKFQRRGVGKNAIAQIWDLHPGAWEVSVMPENTSAMHFWEHAIKVYTHDQFKKETKLVDYDKEQPKRIIFSFDTANDID